MKNLLLPLILKWSFFVSCFLLLSLFGCKASLSSTPDLDANPPPPPPPSASIGLDIQEFPWPPPKASAMYVLPSTIFSNARNLEDINQKLFRALDVNGYSEIRYFSIPSSSNIGFVLVTRLEQINEDATSKKGNERWNDTMNNENFNFGDYIKSIFLTKKGYFRVIAFAVTEDSFYQSNIMPSKATALSWLQTGANKLPNSIGQTLNNPNYKVTALIYEYEQEENKDTAKLEERSKHTGKEHLVFSKILEEITKP